MNGNVNVNHVTHPITSDVESTHPVQETAPQSSTVANSSSNNSPAASATQGGQEDASPSQRTRKLWYEVGHGIDKNSTGEFTDLVLLKALIFNTDK